METVDAGFTLNIPSPFKMYSLSAQLNGRLIYRDNKTILNCFNLKLRNNRKCFLTYLSSGRYVGAIYLFAMLI